MPYACLHSVLCAFWNNLSNALNMGTIILPNVIQWQLRILDVYLRFLEDSFLAVKFTGYRHCSGTLREQFHNMWYVVLIFVRLHSMKNKVIERLEETHYHWNVRLIKTSWTHFPNKLSYITRISCGIYVNLNRSQNQTTAGWEQIYRRFDTSISVCLLNM